MALMLKASNTISSKLCISVATMQRYSKVFWCLYMSDSKEASHYNLINNKPTIKYS